MRVCGFRILRSNSYISVIRSRSRSHRGAKSAKSHRATPSVCDRHGTVSLQLQWRQVHYSHSRMMLSACSQARHARVQAANFRSADRSCNDTGGTSSVTWHQAPNELIGFFVNVTGDMRPQHKVGTLVVREPHMSPLVSADLH